MRPSRCDRPLKLPGTVRPKETSVIDQCRLRVLVVSCKNHAARAAVTRLQCFTGNARFIGVGTQSQCNSLCSDCCDQTARSHDANGAGEIVGEHVQCHLGGHAR